MSASHLILRDDKQDGIRVISVWDRVLKQANCTNYLAYLPTTVVVAVGVEDLLALHAELSRKQTFRQTSVCNN
jgi:hypothetical protein